jgi:outer membrane protein
MFLNLVAQDDYSLRVAYGQVTSSDFGEVLSGNIKSHEEDLSVLSLDAGYLLEESAFELPLDFYLKAGLSVFNENNLQDDVYETTLYFKAYWNFDFWENRVRVGLGEGVSYTDKILYTEYLEAHSVDPIDNNSKILNYIDFSLDLDIGRLIRYKPLYGTNFGWAIKHRSGIYGLINDVKRGGSNYNTLYIESNF